MNKEGDIHCTVVTRWTAGQEVERSILHQGHVSYQIHLIGPDCPRPSILTNAESLARTNHLNTETTVHNDACIFTWDYICMESLIAFAFHLVTVESMAEWLGRWIPYRCVWGSIIAIRALHIFSLWTNFVSILYCLFSPSSNQAVSGSK